MDSSARPAILLDQVSKRYPLYASPRHRLRDLLLGRSSGEHWALLALAGGHPVDLAGEWDGHALLPLGLVVCGQYHDLSGSVS